MTLQSCGRMLATLRVYHPDRSLGLYHSFKAKTGWWETIIILVFQSELDNRSRGCEITMIGSCFDCNDMSGLET